MVPVWEGAAVAAIDLQNSQNLASEGVAAQPGLLLLVAALSLPILSESCLAEGAPDRGLMAYKYLDYQDGQSDAKRIRVKAQALSLMKPVSSDWSVNGTWVTDSISGASPAFHSYALGQMHDRRNALDSEVTRYLPYGTVSLGANYSKESDYLSRGVSFKSSHSDEGKNTTWSWGISLNNDLINPTNGIVKNETKQVRALMAGVTQVVSPVDLIQANLSMTSSRGYLSDPYKVMDERPRERLSRSLLTRWNHHFEHTQNTVRWSYRYFTDDWAIKSHTLAAEYVLNLKDGWFVTPLVRFYSQSAAKFYVDTDLSVYPFPPNPPAQAIYYSEDQRLSAFGARTLGGKVSKQLNSDWTVDMKFENYQQRAEWRLGGGGSPGLLPFYARIVQFGVSTAF